VARNYSKSGMYFETDRPLPPGTTIVTRTQDCDDVDSSEGGNSEAGPAAYYCKAVQLLPEACRELNTLVVAEVKRCEDCSDLSRERYGIGVQYMHPAV